MGEQYIGREIRELLRDLPEPGRSVVRQRGRRGRRGNERRVSLGSFSLHGRGDSVRLTMSKKLDAYDIPNDVGDEVRVEIVERVGEHDYLEIHPVGDGGDER